MPESIKSALVRAARTFIQVLVTLIGTNITEVTSLSALWVVVTAAVPAAIAAVWRAFLDPSPIPSLQDPAPHG